MSADVSRGEGDHGEHPSGLPIREAAQRLIPALRSTWKLATLVGLLALVAMIALLGMLRAAVPPTTTYIARIQFTFPGVIIGRYPNGDAFSLPSIVDPVYLVAAYEKLRVADYGIKRED